METAVTAHDARGQGHGNRLPFLVQEDRRERLLQQFRNELGLLEEIY